MPKRTSRFTRRMVRLGGWILLGLIVSSIGYLFYLDRLVVQRFEGQRWKLPSKIYTPPFSLVEGTDLETARVRARLDRLGYYPVSRPVRQPGEYRWTGESLEIYLHDFSYPERPFTGFPVVLLLEGGRTVRQIIDLTLAEELHAVRLEPELISGLYEEDWEERTLVRLDEVSPDLIHAILESEDRRFYQHPGVDLRGIFRALLVNVRHGRILQGGSTLTQQLVKNFYLDSRRTFTRKINEMIMALLLERHYDKQEILEAYLNEIYLGQNGVMGIYGVGKGSRFYFGKSPADLTLSEAALLAGLIRSPNGLSPYHDAARALARRDTVLEMLFNAGRITLSEYLHARQQRFSTEREKPRIHRAPYFVDAVRKELIDRYSRDLLVSGGLQIFTTLDMQMQQSAEETLQQGLERLERRYPHLNRPLPGEALQGALVALEPDSGAIRAMVGGRHYQTSQFNRVTQARRQPGSLFKPFVYLTAFEASARGERVFTPASLVEDAPLTIEGGRREGEDWVPQNYDKSYHGTVTFRVALENSFNIATIRILQDVGVERVVETAQVIGIQSPLREVPSLALGTSEVSPLEMASAYGTLANHGLRVDPYLIEVIANSDGQVLDQHRAVPFWAVSPQAAYLVNYLLEGVVERGTARGVRRLDFARPTAGKTGTTSDERDAWFVGYTPDLLATVWVGFDDNTTLHLTGSSGALPIWTAFMKQSLEGTPPRDFVPPDGIVFRRVDPETGLRCSRGIDEAFPKGLEPREYCQGESPGFWQWIREIF